MMAESTSEGGCVESNSALATGAPALQRYPAEHIDLVSGVVCSVFQVGKAEILAARRGKAPVAFARQVAMYLTHVALSQSLTEVGLAFNRDRTTVSHACQLVEDRREDPQIDLALDYLERSIMAVAGLGRGGVRA